MIEPQPGTGAASTAYRRLVDNVRRVIAGNDAAVEMAALCVFADGNLLLEGVPGVGKTTLARSLAVSIGGAFSRIQATPDLLPSDLTGVSVYDQREGSFRFMPGPVFANVVLVDEINRTPPRTQAALLEPMEERQVTVEGSTHPLPRALRRDRDREPDRAARHLSVARGSARPVRPVGAASGTPTRSAPARSFVASWNDTRSATSSRCSAPRRSSPRSTPCARVYVDDAVVRYAVELVTATRTAPGVALGASPRSSVALVRCAQARAIAGGARPCAARRREGTRGVRARRTGS